jgi:hypothetical protein
MWIFTLLLELWFIVISLQDFQCIFSAFYIRGSDQRAQQVGFYVAIYVIIMGLLWVVLITVTEELFRTGAQKGDLFRRFAKIAGPEFLFIFLADLVLLWLQSPGGYDWFRWLILGGELLIGVALITFVIRQKKLLPPG